MFFLSFPLAPCTEYLCSLFPLHNLDDKGVFDKGIDPHGQLHNSGEVGRKQCGGYKANKI